MKKRRGVAANLVALILAGCATSQEDRAISGGAAGAGGLAGALTRNSATGALLGGATGGALTSPNQVDLGRPVWR